MKSIAIWEQRNNGSEVQPIELHFNYWKIPHGHKKFYKFLDVGIKLDSSIHTNCINVFFPAKIAKGDFQEIVSKFINKPDLVSAIFNENYQVLSQGASKQHKIQNSDGLDVFTIYQFSPNDVTFDYKYDGTIVSINLPKIATKLYVRFRLTGSFLSQLSSISTPVNSILESAFSELEMIDFRVNEIRDLNKDLIEHFGKMCHIQKQHFFFICSNKEDVVGSHQPYLSCRNLENYRWSGYVDLPNVNQTIFLAYHWRIDNRPDSSLLIKTKYEKNNWNTIGKYLIWVLIVSIFGSFLYDLLKLLYSNF